jgi:primase-polymerase (primpol)-like protein
MRECDRWVVWRYERRNDRWTKIPYQPSGERARTNDRNTWSSLTEVESAYRAGANVAAGIGFCLGDTWAGIDLDDAVDDSDRVHEAASDVLASLPPNSYVERSPSGRGIHAIGRADRIGFEVNCPAFKVTEWQGARFLAITGHGHGDVQDLAPVIERWVPPRLPVQPTRTGFENADSFSDDELLMQAIGADNGEKFFQLFRGDWSAYRSQSEADLALCRMLAFWTNGDAERTDRLFRSSGLCRAKWGGSYRAATLTKALR